LEHPWEVVLVLVAGMITILVGLWALALDRESRLVLFLSAAVMIGLVVLFGWFLSVTVVTAREPDIGPPRCHGTASARGHVPKRVFALAHGVLHPENYELDHKIPLCLGGPDKWSNLQLQPWEEAMRKDHDEWRICREVCAGKMTQSDAVREITEKWLAKP
jgi:hypothetical protein